MNSRVLGSSRFTSITRLVRVEAGALSYMTGKISVHSPLLPSLGGAIQSLLADQAIYRPTYSGTGVITLESSLGGFHVLELNGDSWILERGTYWASEGSVDVKFHRERMQPALWAGEGPIYLQTRVRGHGKVALATRGPVEEITLGEGEEVATEGKYVICRTGDVGFKVRRTTKNFLGMFTSGEGRVRVFEGPGRVLLNPAPYWRYRIYSERRSQADDPSTLTS